VPSLDVDWGHIALAVALISSIVLRFRHREKRSITWVFKWDKERSDETDGRDR
jgi:hypothetical protein